MADALIVIGEVEHRVRVYRILYDKMDVPKHMAKLLQLYFITLFRGSRGLTCNRDGSPTIQPDFLLLDFTFLQISIEAHTQG